MLAYTPSECSDRKLSLTVANNIRERGYYTITGEILQLFELEEIPSHIYTRNDRPDAVGEDKRQRMDRECIDHQADTRQEIESIVPDVVIVPLVVLIQHKSNQGHKRRENTEDFKTIHGAGGKTCTFDLGFMSPML